MIALTVAVAALLAALYCPKDRVLAAIFASLLALLCALLLASQAQAGVQAPAPRGVTVKGVQAGSHQRAMIGRILGECRAMGASPKVQVAAIATTTQEATARNLTGGHGTSVGLFQIINIHGPWRLRHNPEWSARWFCSRAKNVDKHRPRLTIGQLAQAVQRSAHPTAYSRWVREAQRTTRKTTASLRCG